jgi:hypothetical protein
VLKQHARPPLGRAPQVTLRLRFSYELKEALDGFYRSSYKGGLEGGAGGRGRLVAQERGRGRTLRQQEVREGC